LTTVRCHRVHTQKGEQTRRDLPLRQMFKWRHWRHAGK